MSALYGRLTKAQLALMLDLVHEGEVVCFVPDKMTASIGGPQGEKKHSFKTVQSLLTKGALTLDWAGMQGAYYELSHQARKWMHDTGKVKSAK